MLTLSQLLEQIEEDQIAEASFAGDKWYVTKYAGHIWYVDMDEVMPFEIVKLTSSNIYATYYLTNMTL